ncbi:MAG: amino acid-binding protein [Acidimicrobiales bacterium]
MPTYVVRVWLPDRPGALGAVASRIGAVRGDLTGIEILERGGGRAIDELEVVLPDRGLVDLLVAEMTEVDGVDVEDIREGSPDRTEPRVDALETAAVVIEQQSVPDLWLALVDRAGRDFEASWCALVDLEAPALLAADGLVPSARWLANFMAGAGSSERVAAGECGPDGIAAAVLAVGDVGVGLVLGREGRPFRARERVQLAALARIADSRYLELVMRAPRAAHPSGAARQDRRALS